MFHLTKISSGAQWKSALTCRGKILPVELLALLRIKVCFFIPGFFSGKAAPSFLTVMWGKTGGSSALPQ